MIQKDLYGFIRDHLFLIFSSSRKQREEVSYYIHLIRQSYNKRIQVI